MSSNGLKQQQSKQAGNNQITTNSPPNIKEPQQRAGNNKTNSAGQTNSNNSNNNNNSANSSNNKQQSSKETSTGQNTKTRANQRGQQTVVGSGGKSGSSAKKNHQKQSSLALHRSQLQEKLKTNQSQQTNHNSNHSNNTNNNGNNTGQSSTQTQLNQEKSCSTLDEFSKRAQDIKLSIQLALEKQKAKGESESAKNYDNQLIKLKEDIHKLSGIEEPSIKQGSDNSQTLIDKPPAPEIDPIVVNTDTGMPSSLDENKTVETLVDTNKEQENQQSACCDIDDGVAKQDNNISPIIGVLEKNQPKEAQSIDKHENRTEVDSIIQSQLSACELIDGVKEDKQVDAQELLSQTNLNSSLVQEPTVSLSDKIDEESKQIPATVADGSLDKSSLEKPVSQKTSVPPNNGKSVKQKEHINNKKKNTKTSTSASSNQETIKSNEISTESTAISKFDTETKVSALLLSLQNIKEDPSLLESVCKKLVKLSEQNAQLLLSCSKLKSDNQKLQFVKQKLENLCRELQKSNNAIRIESLDLIKGEQNKAKEQTTKVQSTLTGVIKLFDENQQRNMLLRQENQDLQVKLKSLLDHCDNWEKSVEATLRQRDIENRLIKTELAKANLSKNEEKEKLLSEKQELLQILSMMQEQQQRIEGQEAKLRSDLSSYASKYDECQAVISKGMNRFQIESKKMLKQIEQSKQDYKILLSKYEFSDKRMAQLLTEKQKWDHEMFTANKKIETLEKLCRALQERKVTKETTSETTEGNSEEVTNSSNKLEVTAEKITSVQQETESSNEANGHTDTNCCSEGNSTASTSPVEVTTQNLQLFSVN